MKRSSNKGQGALEYLMTYGWAILIIAVVGVVLWQWGVFKPPEIPPGYTGFSQVIPLDWKLDSTQSPDPILTLTLSNQAGTKVTLVRVNASVSNVECNHFDPPVGQEDLRAGQTIQANLICSTIPPKGEYFKANVVIEYKMVASGLTHNSVGEVHASVE